MNKQLLTHLINQPISQIPIIIAALSDNLIEEISDCFLNVYENSDIKIEIEDKIYLQNYRSIFKKVISKSTKVPKLRTIFLDNPKLVQKILYLVTPLYSD